MLPVLVLGRTIAVVVGIAFLPLGILGLLAGLGLLLRKQWGRTLTFMVAVAAILLGLLWLIGVKDVFHDSPDIGVGTNQLVYGIGALILLRWLQRNRSSEKTERASG